MAYKVQFVGLVCFLRENGGRFVLMPDGRQPPPDVDAHVASLIVAPGAVEDAAGWNGDADVANGRFTLSPCSITIEGADIAGDLDTSAHDGKLPQLKHIDPNFAINLATAKTIAKLHVLQGILTAYTVPCGDAVMSQLEVPHDGSIHVSVTPDDGSPEKTIRFAPGTEIALTNTAAGGYAAPDQQNNNFKIYEVLSSQTVSLTEPETTADLTESPSSHVIFQDIRPIGLNTGCSNTGCCDP
jgi:hypothetical protein